MPGVVNGFVLLTLIIGVGALAARFGAITATGHKALADIVFFIGMPAMVFSVMRKASVGEVLSVQLVIVAGSVVVAAGLFLGASFFFAQRSQSLGMRTIGALGSCYENAGNLGIPIALFVLGDTNAVAPVIVLQLLVLAPLAFAVLDMARHNRFSARQAVRQTVSNPISLAAFLGLVVAETGVPTIFQQTIDMMGTMGVVVALLTYGASLVLGPRPLGNADLVPVLVASAVKLVGQPVAAYVLAQFVFGLDALGVLTAVVVAGFPAANNVYIYATRFGVGVTMARDVVFVTTIGSLPSLFVIAALLH